MTRVVITTLRPFRNRGVEALAKSIVQGVIDNFEAPEITVLTNEPDLARKALPQACVRLVPDDARGPSNDVTPWRALKLKTKRWLRRDILGRRRPAEEALAAADIVLVSGGDVFSSTYRTTERYLWQLEYPISLGKPVLFFAQSIGIFETPLEEARFVRRGRKCHFTVRETISRDYLTKIGVPAERITLTADPAFLLVASGPEILDRYGLRGERFITCALSRGISGFKKGLSHEDHVQSWINAGRALLERTDKLVLVPHVQPDETPHENDLFLAREVAAALDDPRVVVMDDPELSSQDFKTALAAAEFNVAERTHGAIGAMSMGVPTLSIGYSIKAEGVLRQLIDDEAVFAKSLVPVQQFTPDRAAALVIAAWEVRDAFRAGLARSLPTVKARAKANYDEMKRLLGRKA